MFTNQIPNFPKFGRQGIPAARPLLTNPLPDLFPEALETPQGWGLTMMLTNLKGGVDGRGQATGHWAGLANLFWWCDREKGVAGMVVSQILPFGGECRLSFHALSWHVLGYLASGLLIQRFPELESSAVPKSSSLAVHLQVKQIQMS